MSTNEHKRGPYTHFTNNAMHLVSDTRGYNVLNFHVVWSVLGDTTPIAPWKAKVQFGGEIHTMFVQNRGPLHPLSGVVYAAGRRKKAKNTHTEHERVQFLGATEHERGPYTHATRQKHTH